MLSDKRVSALLAVAQQRSILTRVNPCCSLQSVAYSPYGYHPELTISLGFNGERLEPITGHYLLGNGYRAFNPVLMRFSSPDSLSPFARGGLNAYAYCLGDPVNHRDPSGHTIERYFVSAFERLLRNAPDVMEASLTGQNSLALKLISLHGSDKANEHSLRNGVSSAFSERKTNGAGFYTTPKPKKANGYARNSTDGGYVYGVFAKQPEIFVPEVHYVQYSSGVLLFLEPAFEFLVVQKEIVGPMHFNAKYVEFEKYSGIKFSKDLSHPLSNYDGPWEAWYIVDQSTGMRSEPATNPHGPLSNP
ncbi:RHS repeat-associated core domain-containing protein [Pseudomonas mosselii]|uniref:RHS repeat-associated core domain-containing protein n=1 Tax=Pseudomonas sp. DVZ24 TaxID=3050942 RepID=UPI0020C54905|nr:MULTISPECIES: RHS repeat-associated core domain-containing protein [unclassified Pseudomonas]MCP8634505.1 RHS repeat-associated core domain-containing protein [Pseudomonas sp. DVZ6]MDD7785271.1 RHS repeat-associated core domain-containing protein [Pseudomonas sp. DVZ24]